MTEIMIPYPLFHVMTPRNRRRIATERQRTCPVPDHDPTVSWESTARLVQ
jgi:hypothetical protein